MKILKKKFLLCLLSLILILSFTGCSGKIDEEPTTGAEDISFNASENDYLNTDESEDELYNFIIDLENVTSDEANEIIKTFDLNEDSFVYERLDENAEHLIVYNKYTGQGYDVEGREYSDIAQLKGECAYCGLLRGIGENMCNGNCNVSFNSIPSGSIVHPDDATMGPLY